MKRWYRSTLMVLAASLFTACSFVGLFYQQIPTLTYWRLDDMLDLNSQQSQQVRLEVDQVFAWHRQRQLPEITQALQRWQQLSTGNLQPQQVCAEYDSLRELTTQLLNATHESWGRLVPNILPEQLDNLARYYQREDTKFEEESMGPAQDEKRLRRYTRWADRLYGSLTRQQTEWLSHTLKQSSYRPEDFLRERQAYQQDVVNTLKRLHGASPEAAQQGIRELQNRHWSGVVLADANAQTRRQELCNLVAGLHNQTTPAQRAQAMKNLASWERELRKLTRP